ncbi:MAG: trigger factor [Clostridia bacterium]|nr:trigger factor [Clostridia bacterium]
MEVKVIKAEDKNEVKLEITVEAKVFEDGIKKVYTKNSKYISIPGFRKGKAPLNIVEKFYGAEIFYEDAFNEIVPKIYENALKDNKIEAVTKPVIDVTQMEKGKDLIFTATVAEKPEVKLGKYKGVSVEKVEYKVTEEDIEKSLTAKQEQNSRIVSVTDRAVETKDITVIDFDGSVDGVHFDGGKAEKYELEIGSNSFIPGFEDQIIGMKIDEEKDINVKFPEDYFSKELAGKDAVFAVKLHEIKRKELPELDDEFAKDVSEFDTLKELKEDIKANLTKSNEEKAKHEIEEAAITAACDAAKVEIPEGMVEIELDNMVEDMNRRLQYQGINFDQYLNMIGRTMADFRSESKETAEKSVKTKLVLEAIFADAKLEVKEDEVEGKLKELADAYGRNLDELKANEALIKNITESLQSEKAISFVAENVKLEAKKAAKKEEKEETKKTTKKSTKKAE